MKESFREVLYEYFYDDRGYEAAEELLSTLGVEAQRRFLQKLLRTAQGELRSCTKRGFCVADEDDDGLVTWSSGGQYWTEEVDKLKQILSELE